MLSDGQLILSLMANARFFAVASRSGSSMTGVTAQVDAQRVRRGRLNIITSYRFNRTLLLQYVIASYPRWRHSSWSHGALPQGASRVYKPTSPRYTIE